jgi:hypothetical protein
LLQRQRAVRKSSILCLRARKAGRFNEEVKASIGGKNEMIAPRASTAPALLCS